MEIDQVTLMQSSIHNEYNAEPICVQGYIVDLYSNSLRPVFTDRNYFIFKFLKDLYSQYEYNMRLILTELILCSNFFKLVFMNHIYFVFKLLQTCIHESQLFLVQIVSNLY